MYEQQARGFFPKNLILQAQLTWSKPLVREQFVLTVLNDPYKSPLLYKN